jgi:hypothetical protein
MESITVAASFATIVGLLADFSAHRSDQRSAELSEFLEWLSTHGHSEVLKAIESSHLTSVSIKAALAEGNRQLLDRLISIDRSLVALCEAEGPLGALAKSVNPRAMLSDQAKHILVSFEETGAGAALELWVDDGMALIFMDRPGEIDIEDQRFYRDDVDQLIELGLFRITFNDKGERIFNLTRTASAFAQTLLHEKR